MKIFDDGDSDSMDSPYVPPPPSAPFHEVTVLTPECVALIRALEREKINCARLADDLKEASTDYEKLDEEKRDLQKENNELKRSIYFHKRNTKKLGFLMRSINARYANCFCSACVDSSRAEGVAVQTPCTFKPFWETLLNTYGITHAFVRDHEVRTDKDRGVVISGVDYCIVQFNTGGERDGLWRNVAYGDAMYRRADWDDYAMVRHRVDGLFNFMADAGSNRRA